MGDKELAKKAYETNDTMNHVSMYIWQLCCIKHGFGGEYLARVMYEDLMKEIFDKYEIE